MPALYYANRLQENPIPNLSSIEPEANVQLDNIALGHINEVNAEEQEVVIPINHLNPIVLLERVFQENQAFEAEYEVDGGAANPFGEDAFADPLDLVYGEEEPAIKYEIILEQDDLDEVDGILNENSGNECEPMDSNAGTNMDTVEQFAVDDVTANGTDQIGINNVFVHPSHMDMDIKIEVNDDATADQRITHQKVASSSGVWDIDLNDNADGATQYDRESITTANVPDHNETSNEVNDMDIENEILDNMGSAQENGEHGPSLAIIIDQNETNNAVEPTFSDGWTKAAANHDESDDDVLYIEPTSSWPAPKTFEIADFVKKENDRFSGDLPFSQRVCMRFGRLICLSHSYSHTHSVIYSNFNFQSKSGKSWREYIIGFDRVIKVPQTNVNTCIKFSTYPFASELIYDQKLVHAMVVLCSTKRELQLGKVNRDVVEFIRRTYLMGIHTEITYIFMSFLYFRLALCSCQRRFGTFG